MCLKQVFVKALAMLRDGSKQSSVVTKRFTVDEAEASEENEQVVEEIVSQLSIKEYCS